MGTKAPIPLGRRWRSTTGVRSREADSTAGKRSESPRASDRVLQRGDGGIEQAGAAIRLAEILQRFRVVRRDAPRPLQQGYGLVGLLPRQRAHGEEIQSLGKVGLLFQQLAEDRFGFADTALSRRLAGGFQLRLRAGGGNIHRLLSPAAGQRGTDSSANGIARTSA